MSWSYLNAGARAESNYAAITPGMPAARASGNTLVLLSHIRNSAASFTGYGAWQEIGTVSASAHLWVHAITDDGSMSAPTLTPTGGSSGHTCLAQIFAFGGGLADVSNIIAHGPATSVNSTVDQTVETPALTITIGDTLVLCAFAHNDDNTSVDNPTGTNPWVAAQYVNSALGADSSIGLKYIVQTTATSIGADTFTVSGAAAAVSGVLVVALKPAAVIGGGLLMPHMWDELDTYVRM